MRICLRDLKKIVAAEARIDEHAAEKLVRLATMTRALKGSGLDEGASTRLLVHAAKLMHQGVAPRVACAGAIAQPLTDEADMLRAVNELAASIF